MTKVKVFCLFKTDNAEGVTRTLDQFSSLDTLGTYFGLIQMLIECFYLTDLWFYYLNKTSIHDGSAAARIGVVR